MSGPLRFRRGSILSDVPTFAGTFRMVNSQSNATRRQFIRGATVSAAGLTLPAFWFTPGAFAETFALTPAQTEGPFYPDRLPLDTDNDLITANDSITPAIGEITHLPRNL